MRVTYTGHAGLHVATAHANMLCDPWFSPEGAYQASWFQYPDNEHLLEGALGRPDAILISHEHLDHVDPWFLARVPADVPVYFPRYPLSVLRRKIESAGPRPLFELNPWETTRVANGLDLFFVPEESPMSHDSAMVIQADDQVLLNLNDARLSTAQFRSIRARVDRPIDVFSLQGSGASWYPICYEYGPERRREVSEQKRMGKMKYVERAVKVVAPKVVIPFAGPPCFLDPDLAVFNDDMDDGIFPDQKQITDWLVRRGLRNAVLMLPGDAWDATVRSKQSDPRWTSFSFEDRQPYLEEYARRRRPHIEAVLARYPDPSGPLWQTFRAYFENLLTMSPYFNRKINMVVAFEITGPGGGAWSVDFRPGSEGVRATTEGCSYRYRFASRWLVPLLEGAMPWEDFFLSLRFSAWRDPDVYNDHLLGLLKFADPEALAAVERFETSIDTSQWVTIHSGDREYRVQRLCPHAGLDLRELGEVQPGHALRCLGHDYVFDLETGRCLNGNCVPLAVTRAENE